MLARLFPTILLVSSVFAQEGTKAPYDTQKLTVPFLSADKALSRMELPPGFEATVFAAEPHVRQPIGFTIDERGRLWVVENDTYAERPKNFDTELRDRVLIFEDSDNDGTFDKRLVFWEDGIKATSVEVGFGGVYVMAPPRLLFIPDADKDDVPDGPPQVLLDGFDADVIRHNLANGLMWGPDGWLYGRHGIQNPSLVGKPGSTGSQRTNVTCCIWRFHPTRKEFQVVASGGTNPWGLDYNRHGEFFMINTVIGHLWHVVPGACYRRMYGSHFNPYVYDVIEQTADHFHWDTREAAGDVGRGMSDNTDKAGGGHAHTGFMIYQGDNWPEYYRDKTFTLNFHGRRMNCDRLVREGNGYTGKHEPDLFKTGDPWFRGVELKSGPDGAVYVLDWSDIGECHENDGVHRSSGRIYKLFHKNADYKPSKLAGIDLSKLSNKELLRLLHHKNVWHERTARRILMERAVAGQDMQPAIQQLLTLGGERTPELQLRVMWTLYCMGYQDEAWLRGLLNHPSEHVKVWAVRLLCDRDGPLAPKTIEKLTYLSEFAPSGLFRLHLASAMNRLPAKDRLEVAVDLVKYQQDTDDRMQPLMIWYGIEPAVLKHPRQAMAIATSSKIPLVRQLISRRFAAEYQEPKTLAPLITALGQVDAERQADMLTGISAALKGVRKAAAPQGWNAFAKTASQNELTADLVREIGVVFGDGRALDDVRRIATDRNAPDDARIEAIRVLANARPKDLFKTLRPMVTDRVAAGAAVRALAVCEEPGVADAVLRGYSRLAADDRSAAIDTLTARATSAKRLLAAVVDGRIRKSAITAFHARQIRSFGDTALTAKLSDVWGDIRETSADRKAAMAEVEKLVTDSNRKPDLTAGRAIFKKTCANCHVMYGEGGNIGPDLTGSNRSNLNYLLENILDPSASVAASYKSSIVITADGRSLNGVVVEEDDNALTLQTDKVRVRITKDDIDERRATNQSLMPDGLLKGLSTQEIVDLFGYLQSR